MPRGLSTEIKAAIAAGTVRPVYLAYFQFDGGVLRTWTGEGDLTYDSVTWHGNGAVTSWPTITESVDLVASNAEFTLSGQFDYGVDIADPAIYRSRACTIFIGLYAADGTLPATNIYKVFSGRMAVVGFVEDTAEDGYSLSVESRMVDLQKAKPARFTHQNQLQRFAGDNGLEYAGAAQDSLFLSRGETPDKPFSHKVIYGTTVVEGSVVFVGTSGSGSRYLNLCIAFAGHECDAIEQLYLDDRAVLSDGAVAGEFVGVVDYYPHLGTDAQTYDTDLSTAVTDTVWDSTYRLRGITYVYLRILYSEELFGGDAPAVSARIRGKKLHDPRTGSAAYSDNAALVIRDYLLSESYGFSGGSAEVDDASVTVAANDCDYQITMADSATEKRYTINGWLDTAQTIGANLQQLLGAMAGKVSYQGGRFAVYAGVYVVSPITITDGDLTDAIQFQNRNLREAFNGVRGLYRTPDLDWQEEDYPAYQNAAAVTADGEDRWIDLALPFTTSAARCQRIAKIAVMRSRAARTLQLSVKLSSFEIRAGDIVSISTGKSGIGSVAYEVRSLSIALDMVPRLNLELIEVAAADYTWDESSEEASLTVPEEPADSILSWTLARLASPSATPGSRSFNSGFNATVTASEAGTTCHYTTDGSEPNEDSSTIANGGTIAIGTSDTTLKLKTFQDDGSLTSAVVTLQYTYSAPVVSLSAPQWVVYNAALVGPVLDLYLISVDNNRKLYFSSNSGSSFSLVSGDADIGEIFRVVHFMSYGYDPSVYRAYVTNGAGDQVSNIVQLPSVLTLQANRYEVASYRLMAYQAGATVHERARVIGGSYNDWRTVFTVSTAGQRWEIDGSPYPNLYNGSQLERQYYLSKPGWTNSPVQTVSYNNNAGTPTNVLNL